MARRTLIHLSDLHIGLRSKESARTKMIFDKIAKSFPGIPIIITGDLTDSATKSQLKKTREFLNQLVLSNPILVVPGNHDYAWKGNILRDDGWENWVRYLGSPLGWGKDEVSWMGIDYEPKGVDGLGDRFFNKDEETTNIDILPIRVAGDTACPPDSISSPTFAQVGSSLGSKTTHCVPSSTAQP